MIEELFTFPSTIKRLRYGPLNEHLDAYAAARTQQGFQVLTIKQQIVTIADLSRRMKQKHIEVEDLDPTLSSS